jgi:hypothetical protein
MPISSASALGRQRPIADGVILLIVAAWFVLESRRQQ